MTAELLKVGRKFGEKMENSTDCLNLNAELWLFRADLSTRWYTMLIFACLYLVIITAGFIGNTCVILAITRNKSLQTVPNLFILSLSCSDIVVCCTSATITPITAFRKEWIFGEVLCRVAPFIAGISLCFSTFTLTAISIDRFILIRFPMRKPFTHYQALIVIALICVFAATITSPIMFKQKLGVFANFCGLYCTENWGTSESQRKLYGAVLMFLQLVIPLTIIIISYTAISLRLGQSMILKGAKKQRENNNWVGELSEQQRIAVKRRQRTNRMLIGMVVAFACSWIWSVTFNILRDYEYLPELIREQEYLFGIATHCIAMTSTVWNPLLYAVLNLQLRAAFIDLMPHWLRIYLKLENDDHSSLLTRPTHVSNKYGSTATQALKSTYINPTNGQPFVSTTLATPQIHRNSSFKSNGSFSKKSVIRILVPKQRASEDEEHLLNNESPSPPEFEMQTLVALSQTPRRKSAQPNTVNEKIVLPRKSSF